MALRISRIVPAGPEPEISPTPEPPPKAPANHVPPPGGPKPLAGTLRSGPCRQEQLESREFLAWRGKLGIRHLRYHRKDWEWAFICQALEERGMLAAGRKGLGFAVGREQLAALFAASGCEILATDLGNEAAGQSGWAQTQQHCLADPDVLNRHGLCEESLFRRQVSFRAVDMRAIPGDIRGFDFAWSSCSMEHLGSLAEGERFVFESLRCLRPGGVAVHTTEFNVHSNGETLEEGGTVLFRRRDLEALAAKLRVQGHSVDMDFTLGNKTADLLVQQPPYLHDVHLRIQLGPFVATSYGMILRKSEKG